ncbi:unnamed protein product [Diabrotica balteata]|uniref:Peptidase S1 domain-containing protein n=1 Tax=Diabrotica balteata TaxID=107213 RepID=A0A9N9X511_DIABA|nr:unnamed protein product [Diabrotica balteata]
MRILSTSYFLFALFIVEGYSAALNKTKSALRIVGGQDALIQDYPYQVSILFYGKHGCGGSIINPNYILTAAHCTYDVTESVLAVRVNSSFRDEQGTLYEVEKIFVHDGFDDSTYDNDISILRLARPLSFGTGVSPISLATAGTQITDGLEAYATGWGRLGEHLPASHQLQVVMLPVISTETCAEYYPSGWVTRRMFCAGYYEQGGKDTCEGDSGGPLVVSGIQIGVVSWGTICAAPKRPGAFTKLPEFVDYINSIIYNN